ncbi:hypothetical protein BV22DRAFT_1038637 [Leucogyrophana mollusca]|uniref:Uncharacterized protein n=1 Tax=Leucogyrophana mollusca TaxID=85980 RepID=A0ACB8B864_9AGAM|nr:hypothetical protein BV22DRAFT_1038637 [Leucogyrophana mollusca]
MAEDTDQMVVQMIKSLLLARIQNEEAGEVSSDSESDSDMPSTATRSPPPPAMSPNGKPRLTRADIDKIPEFFRKSSTPEEIEYFFDNDGYLLPQMQAIIDNNLADVKVCYICRKSAKSKCSKCKMVTYCSQACQRSHWKTHKPLCMMARDPMNYPPQYADPAAAPNAEFAKHVQVGLDMRQRGRRYGSVRSMLHAWLKECPHAGNITVVTQTESNLLTVLRDKESGELKLFKEQIVKHDRTPRPRDRIKSDATAARDIEKYIADTIETVVPMLYPPLVTVYGEFCLQPASKTDFANFNADKTRRGAEIVWRGGRVWDVLQFEPDSLRESDELINPGVLTGTGYPW